MNFIKKKWYFSLIFAIIIADQITKFIIRTNFNLYEQVNIIKSFAKIIYIRNSGVIWGLFSNSENRIIPILVTILSIAALITVLYIFLKTSITCKLELLSLSFIMGGAIGNIIDRFMLGYVVDFIDIYIKSYHWPTFNIADSFISMGIILLLISVLRNKCVTLNTKEN